MLSLAWVASHAVAVTSIWWLASLGGEITRNSLLYGIPLTLGLVQWAFLYQRMRWYGLLWLPSCVVGLFLSFLGSWWFMCALGTGLGLAQSPILGMSGFRRWWLWVPASGCGWLIGIVIGSYTQDLLGAIFVSHDAQMSVVYGVTALAYGALTAAALHLMPYASSRAKCEARSFDSPTAAEPGVGADSR